MRTLGAGILSSLLCAALVLFIGCSSCPLSEAAYNGNLADARTLIDRGADPNSYDRWGWTPLLWAVYYINYDIAAYLLEHGSDPDAVTRGEYGPIARGSTPLIIASYYGHTHFVGLLLGHGANAGIADSRGFTAMSYAKCYGHEGVIELLGEGRAQGSDGTHGSLRPKAPR